MKKVFLIAFVLFTVSLAYLIFADRNVFVTYRIVDKDNHPIPDVLALVVQRPYILIDKKCWASISDSDGALVGLPKNKDMLFYKPGYYPLVMESYYIPADPEEGYHPEKPQDLTLFISRKSTKSDYQMFGTAGFDSDWNLVEHTIDENIEIRTQTPFQLANPPHDYVNSLAEIKVISEQYNLCKADMFYWSNAIKKDQKTKKLKLKRGETFFILNQDDEPLKKIRIDRFGCYSIRNEDWKLEVRFKICDLNGDNEILAPELTNRITDILHMFEEFEDFEFYQGPLKQEVLKEKLKFYIDKFTEQYKDLIEKYK